MAGRWFLFLLWLAPTSLGAQPLVSRSLSLQQGLPEFYVSGIVQDKAGFVWIATRDGLARYDGRRFKLFRHQPRNARSLANNVIVALQTVSDSTLLVQLENGTFQLFNPQTEQFHSLLTRQRLDQAGIQVHSALMSRDGQHFWGRHEQHLMHYALAQKRMTVFPFPQPDSLYAGGLLLDTTQARIYAPVPGKLLELDTRTGSYRAWSYAPLGQSGTVRTYYKIPLVRRSNGELLTAAPGRLIAYQARPHRFRAIPIPGTRSTSAGVLYAAPDGNTYFTYAMTVYRLSADDQITPLWTAPRLDYQNYFHALLLDRSGVLWVGTNGDGVQQIDLRALPMKTYPYRTNFTADLLSVELGQNVPDWAKADHMSYLLRWSGGGRYLAGWAEEAHRLLRTNRAQHQLQRLLAIWPTSLTPYVGNGLRATAQGQLLYVPFQGILHVDTTGRLLAQWPLRLDRVNDIQPMGNRVWLATEFNGLYAYDLEQRRIVRHLRYRLSDATSLTSDNVLCLAADPGNPAVLWVGTQEGLSRLDTRTRRCQNWTEQQGLPNATINCLLPDGRGRLWFSTLRGISRLDPRTGQMRHFTTDDGLLDIEYKLQHGVQLPDGRLAFGGAIGMTVIDPSAMEDSPQPIPIALTALRIGNVPIEPRPAGSPLTRSLNATPALDLNHTQNFLSLEFAGLQYNKPATLQYRYQLRGVDADWVYVGNQNMANYTQLAPGTYEFRVNAADALGRWSPHVKTIQVRIAPPWWRTGWAYALYAGLLAGLIRLYVQYRLRAQRLRLTAQLSEQEARQLRVVDEIKSRFFANITHELRTPLTLILGPIERLKGLLPGPEPLRWLTTVDRQAQDLLGLINQLLDLAKLDSGLLPIHLSRGSVGETLRGLLAGFEEQARSRRIRLALIDELVADEYWFDADKLIRIVTNLVANALRWTPPEGLVTLGVGIAAPPELDPDHPGPSPTEPGVYLTVSDTGTGMAASQLPRIFDRFYQAVDSAPGNEPTALGNPGTGIGLALVHELVELQQGWIRVQSRQAGLLPFSTRFTLWLPYQLADEVPLTSPDPVVDVPLSPASPPLDGKHPAPAVLIVEDNAELSDFITESLAPHYRISRAANGQEGWAIATESLPDLIISDVMMPLMDGFSLCQRLKADATTNHIPLILLTAKATHQSRIQGLTAGADDYLTKPFHVDELQLRVHNLLLAQQRLREWVRQSLTQVSQPAPAPPVEDPFLTQLYAVLDQSIGHSDLTVDQLADAMAVSLRTLHRKLAALTGMSANELLRTYRLRQAARLLKTGQPVSSVAYAVGFESGSYFAKCFKEQFGLSPSDYQARSIPL